MRNIKLRWFWLASFCFLATIATHAQTFTPSPDVLNEALNANLVRWKADPETNPEYTTYNALATAKAMNYLALVAYHNPSNTAAVNRLLSQIRSVIAGGNEPTCRGAILGWTDNALAQSLTLAKNTPAVWGQLTPAEINKCDWLMRALTVAGNYFQNYYNEPKVCLLNVFQYAGKRNAPNIVEGYVGIMITAHRYWGGAAAVNQLLADFNYDTYLATFESLGFTNIIFGWTYAYGNTPEGRAQMKSLMENGGTDKGGGTINEQGVKRPFTFESYYSPFAEVPYEPFQIYQALTERMYRHITHNQSNSGQAYILNNRISPMTGLMGMCNELQGSDGSGERSSVRYTYDGWSNSILTYASLRTLGLWGNTAAHQDIDRRIRVGSIDLLYKYKAGYRGRSNGEFLTHTEPTGITFGYIFLKDIWINYLWDRKDMNLLELMSPTLTESFTDVTLGSSFSDGQFTGNQGLVWNYTQARQAGASGVKPNDTKFIALAANSGVLRSTLTKPVKIIRFKVRNLSGEGSPSVTVKLNDQVLRTYSSFSTDETAVIAIADLTASSGDQLIITNSGSTEVLIDDLELEQVSAPEAPVNLTASNIQMRELTLTWADSATTETGFRLERREMPNGSFQDIQSNLPANTTQYVDQGLQPETIYEYRLSAFNLAGSSPVILTTAETLPLVAQDSVSFTPVADAYVQAGASTSGSNYGTRTFLNVKWAGATNSATRESFMRFDLSSVTKRIRRATLRLYASGIEASTTNPLTARLDLIQQNDWDETTITWNNSRSFTSLGELHRWDPFLGVNTVDLETDLFQDQLGGLLTMKISVLESLLLTLGSREASNASQRPLLTLYVDLLNAPTNLSLSGNAQPVLTWSDNASNETGFTIQRKPAGGSFANLATVAANITTFTDLNAQPGITYTYRVYASNDGGKSAYSNTVDLTTPTLQVLHKDGDNGQLTNNQIAPQLQLKNLGSTAVPYQELTVRYWFTSENHASINTFIDWAQLGTSQVKTQYVRLSDPHQGADGYVEYGFEAGAGQLAAGGQSGLIQTRIAKQTWTAFNEADDYSYVNNTDFATTSKVTLYRNGTLIWGVEPGAVSSVTQVVAESENKNQTTNSNTINTYLRLQNTGNVALAYKDLKVRYWFTAEGNQPLNYWIDYAALGGNNITGQVVKPSPARTGADTYLEFNFSASLGSLEPSSSTGNIQYRIAKNDWSSFNETDDHSYKVVGPMTANSKITVYYKGQLLYGSEPASGGARVAAVDAENVTENWTIYPNPANDQVILDGGNTEKVIDITIFGLTGQTMQREQTYFKTPIRVGQLPQGTYLLRVVQDQQVQHLKLLKQ